VSFAPAFDPYCDCTTAGLQSLDPERDAPLISVVREKLTASQQCRAPCCAGLCLCELPQLSGGDLDYCWGLDEAPRPFDEVPSGWCYVDPDDGFGNPELVEQCRAAERRRFRALPDRTWDVVLACQDYVTY
jgi:hypothetical protein